MSKLLLILLIAFPFLSFGAANQNEVILLTSDQENISIKQCDETSFLENQELCTLKEGTSIQVVKTIEFTHKVKMSLKLPLPNLRKNNKAEAFPNVNKINSFIENFSPLQVDPVILSKLRTSLDKLNTDILDRELNSIIIEINANLDKLVNYIFSIPSFSKFVLEGQEYGFVFNILKSYLRVPVIDTSFVNIPKGTFTMGSPVYEPYRGRDEEQKEVTISKDFHMMTTEVTQMQWFLVMGYNPSKFKRMKDCNNQTMVNGERLCPNNPIDGVSWTEVQEFIRRLNQSPGQYSYKLPTEAQWEYATRGGTNTFFSFGNDFTLAGEYAWYDYNSERKSHPVGMKKPNPFGLYDVHGNVDEWVQDLYSETYAGGIDPQGPEQSRYRVIRGGGWFGSILDIRSAFRMTGYPWFRYTFVGFRLIRTVK